MTLTTKIEHHTILQRMTCFCCGSFERPGHGYVSVSWDGEEVGIVCEDCVRQGQDTIAARMHGHIHHLRNRAHDMKVHADDLEEIAANGMPLPALSDFKAAQDAVSRAYGHEDWCLYLDGKSACNCGSKYVKEMEG